jgi:hypothetical protein
MTTADWTQQEQTVAQQAFEYGNSKSVELLILSLQRMSQSLSTVDSVWEMHDFLSTERHNYEGRSSLDYGNILFTLAEMLKREWISLDHLDGLDAKKLSKIKAMSLF